MKGLNFWQWLGIGLLVVALLLMLNRRTGTDTTPNNTTPATQPR